MLAVSPFEDSAKSSTNQIAFVATMAAFFPREHALERCAASRPFCLRMSWRPLQTSQGLALGSGRDLFQSPGQVDQTFDIVSG